MRQDARLVLHRIPIPNAILEDKRPARANHFVPITALQAAPGDFKISLHPIGGDGDNETAIRRFKGDVRRLQRLAKAGAHAARHGKGFGQSVRAGNYR